jgi:hypothetical protein
MKMQSIHLLWSAFALVVCVCHITVILVYFLGLVKDHEKDYVSSILHHDRLYMNLMTFFVLLQLTACLGFVRIHARALNAVRVFIETLFLAVAWVGWCILISKFGTGSEVSRLHFLGVGLFVSGGVVYFAFLIWELYDVDREEWVSAILIVLYVASAVLGLLFIYGYFAGWEAAWLFEHLAFTIFSLAHFFLFYIDMNNEVEARGVGLFDSLRIDLSCT